MDKKLSPSYIGKLPAAHNNTLGFSFEYFQNKYGSDVIDIINISTSHPYEEVLKKEFDSKLVGQNKAKDILIQAILDSLFSVGEQKGPLGVYFFHGPTGVGKSEIVKILSEILFGVRNGFIDIRGENYRESHFGSNLFGAPKGYVGYGDKIPFSQERVMEAFDIAKKCGKLNPMIANLPWVNLILVDEVEKMHPSIVQQFLGILDDGKITTSSGEIVNLSNSIIIFTSNIGQKEIVHASQKSVIGFQSQETVFTQDDKQKLFTKSLNDFFTPEFLGRVHTFVEFESLDIEAAKNILQVEIDKLNIYLKKYYIETSLQIEISPGLIDYILNKGFSQKTGARDLVRVFNTTIKRYLGRKLASTDFQEYVFDRSVILGLDVKNDEICCYIIRTKSDILPVEPQPENLGTMEFPRNLDSLSELYNLLHAYGSLYALSIEDSCDLNEDLKIYADQIVAYGIPKSEIMKLKDLAFLQVLDTFDFIHDYSVLRIGGASTKDFYPYSERVITKIILSKLDKYKQYYPKSEDDDKFRSQSAVSIRRAIEGLFPDKELTPQQNNKLIHLINKIMEEKYNMFVE